MQDNIDIYEEERPWGSFRKFTDNTPSTIKVIKVKPNETLSLQSHEKRSEFWRVISGSGIFEIDGKVYKVEKDSEYNVPIGSKHRLSAGEDGLEVLEIATGDFDEKDIIRYEDKYGRV
jgi:mannose-6-phosphate isomerase-like protein (cupin superfamily)